MIIVYHVSMVTLFAGDDNDAQCSSSDSLDIVSQLCTHKNSCPLVVDNDLLGSSCPGENNQLTVVYTCACELSYSNKFTVV